MRWGGWREATDEASCLDCARSRPPIISQGVRRGPFASNALTFRLRYESKPARTRRGLPKGQRVFLWPQSLVTNPGCAVDKDKHRSLKPE